MSIVTSKKTYRDTGTCPICFNTSDMRDTIGKYQKIVVDQEKKIVDLQVEAYLRANEFRELKHENDELCNKLNGYETERW